MGRKGKKLFGRALTDAAGIPPELVSSLPLLSMTGQEELFIENFKGILQYTDAVLLLQTKACLLRIEGQHLFLVYYTKDALKLTGGIFHDGENPALHQGLCEDPGPDSFLRPLLKHLRPSRFLHMGSHPKRKCLRTEHFHKRFPKAQAPGPKDGSPYPHC